MTLRISSLPVHDNALKFIGTRLHGFTDYIISFNLSNLPKVGPSKGTWIKDNTNKANTIEQQKKGKPGVSPASLQCYKYQPSNNSSDKESAKKTWVL